MMCGPAGGQIASKRSLVLPVAKYRERGLGAGTQHGSPRRHTQGEADRFVALGQGIVEDRTRNVLVVSPAAKLRRPALTA